MARDDAEVAQVMGRREDIKVYGFNACRALFLRRPQDITRVYVHEDQIDGFRDLLAMCARLRVSYRVVPERDLELVTESRHHEGICIVARPRATAVFADLVRGPGGACVLGMAGVGNPHNVGAILRTAAHFGVRGAVFLSDEADGTPSEVDDAGGDAKNEDRPEERPEEGSVEDGPPARAFRLPPSAARTAQGAAEWLDIVAQADVAGALRAARSAGFTVAATSSRGGQGLYGAPLPTRLFLLVGAEDEGLSEATLAAADLVLAIPGTGHVESLNVAAATAVVLAEHWRQRTAERGASKTTLRPAGAATPGATARPPQAAAARETRVPRPRQPFPSDRGPGGSPAQRPAGRRSGPPPGNAAKPDRRGPRR